MEVSHSGEILSTANHFPSIHISDLQILQLELQQFGPTDFLQVFLQQQMLAFEHLYVIQFLLLKYGDSEGFLKPEVEASHNFDQIYDNFF